MGIKSAGEGKITNWSLNTDIGKAKGKLLALDHGILQDRNKVYKFKNSVTRGRNKCEVGVCRRSEKVSESLAGLAECISLPK